MAKKSKKTVSEPKGLKIQCVFSTEGVSPFDEVEWEKRTALISDDKGNIIFEQADCEFPKEWSQQATNVVASKYFYGELGTPERETSVRQLIERVADTIANWGNDDGYFATPDDADRFCNELTHLCLNQYGSFNSPVWFNVGLFQHYRISGPENNWRWSNARSSAIRVDDAYEYPQASACFIQGVDDDMESIMALATSEAMLFKGGSGTGTDLSTLRSSREKLSGGGKPSGPISFMKVYDAIAGVVKSGGKNRRAAKLQTLSVFHPDILEFIECKTKEEKKAKALIDAGYEANFNGEAYGSVFFQNSNLSVRATDDFMMAVSKNDPWITYAVTTGEPMEVISSRLILDKIAESAWACGDPGLQYNDTINKWHTCPNTAAIYSANPCSEYLFINDSSCNLASLNLLKFLGDDGRFHVEKFRQACHIFIIAQEILVDNASYPTQKICENTHKFRPLGLGYSNLGAFLMANGLPYDSGEGRTLAATLTAIMTGEAYRTSALIAKHMGTFEGFNVNRNPMLNVIKMHGDAINDIESYDHYDLIDEAHSAWGQALELGNLYGYRNSQATVLAPCGTISFMMDCDTTGVEPEIALVKYKQLAGSGKFGGGTFKIVNRTVSRALRNLGYDNGDISEIVDYLISNCGINDAPGLHYNHIPVFDTAFAPCEGGRTISIDGHLDMMAAVQPFISGAISKTVNVPRDATVDDIREVYFKAWKLGIKAVAVYRDGSKSSQPLSTKPEGEQDGGSNTNVGGHGVNGDVGMVPIRTRLPMTRQSLTHKFDIQGNEGYITVGMYPNSGPFDIAKPGELFITMAKEGSTIGGLMDALGTSISIGLQYGVPIEVLVDKFMHSRFEPSGFTKNPEIPIAKSLTDYIFRWLGMEFIPGYREANALNRDVEESIRVEPQKQIDSDAKTSHQFQSDAPCCDVCGSLTVRSGTCYRCLNCGHSMGCS